MKVVTLFQQKWDQEGWVFQLHSQYLHQLKL